MARVSSGGGGDHLDIMNANGGGVGISSIWSTPTASMPKFETLWRVTNSVMTRHE